MSVKLPPPEKFLEAWSAIGANRVHLLSPLDASSGEAEVKSSDNSKIYRLAWDGKIYRSTDNATVWQAYPGYPVLALLMLKGLLPLPQDLATLFAPINWHELNKKSKADYSRAAHEAFATLKLDEAEVLRIEKLVQESCALLSGLDIELKRMGRPRKKVNQ